MKLSSLLRSRTRVGGVTGLARLDRRTANLTRRLRPGDIAVLDHVDIDRAAAVALIECGAAAVVNAAPSVSGRYPSLGAGLLVDAGIPLVDEVGSEVFAVLDEGDLVRVEGDTVYLGDLAVASGNRQSRGSVSGAVEASKAGVPTRLEAFSADTVEHVRREPDLLLDQVGVPDLATRMGERQVLVVVPRFGYRAELRALKTYLRENSPVLVGVGQGADALLLAGYKPNLVVCDGDDVSDAALRCGAEVVARAGLDGRVAGAERFERLGTNYVPFQTACTTEDAALLLAHAGGASLIVLAGSPGSLVELMDRGRSAMASGFLVHAAVGSRLADARAVAQLYRNRLRGWLVLLVLLLAVAVVAAALATTPVGQDWWHQIHDSLLAAYTWVRERIR